MPRLFLEGKCYKNSRGTAKINRIRACLVEARCHEGRTTSVAPMVTDRRVTCFDNINYALSNYSADGPPWDWRGGNRMPIPVRYCVA